MANIPKIDADLEVINAQRTPCILVLDTSGSMSSGGRIDKLNDGLAAFQRTVTSDETLCQHVMLMIIGFGTEAEFLCDWTQADEFQAPVLKADGQTAMGEAMRMAHAAIVDIRVKLKSKGIPYTRPWIFLISDGGPNDEGWEQAAAESRKACEDKLGPVVWPIAVPPDADGAALKLFARGDMKVYSLGEDANFRSFFERLSSTLGALCMTPPGQKIQIQAPTDLVIDA